MKKVTTLLLVFFSLASLAFVAQGKTISGNSKDGKLQSGHVRPLKVGVASMITPVDTVKYYQEIIDYIGEKTGMPVQMVHRRTYEEMDALLERGEVKLAFICSAPYVRDHDRFGVELLAAPQVDGRPSYCSYIIVHKDSPISSFSELKGKTFAFTDPNSNTGKLYPSYLLKTMGESAESYFRDIFYSYSHNKSIELVAKKSVDGAAVENHVYDYMRKTGSPYAAMTKIVKRSPYFGMPPVVVTKDMDAALKEKIRRALLKMSEDKKGASILKAMMVEGFVNIEDSAYDEIRKMERLVMGQGKPVKKQRETRTVNFGVIPRDNPRLLYEKYQPLLDYLAEKTPYSYELVLKKNYEETVNAIGSGEIDVALLGPLTYLEARAKYGVRCILKPRGQGGNATYKSVIIRKKDSPLRSLSGLKGRSMAFSATKSTSGNLFPRYLLAKAGLHLNSLGSYTNFDYHDSVVKAVLKGQYDAGAVRDSVAKKYMKLGLEPLAESELIPFGPLVAGPGAPYAVIESIKKALLDLDPGKPSDARWMGRLDEDLRYGFTETREGDYEDIRAKLNAVPRTCGKGCHPDIRL